MRKMSEIRKTAANMAGLRSVGKGVTKALIGGTGGVIGLALGSAMANVLERKIQSGMSQINKGKHYKNMLSENKINNSVPAQRAFRTLHNFSPSMASDPMVAGTFVRRVVDYDEMIDVSQIKTLVDIEDKRNKGLSSIPPAFAGGFASGMGSIDPWAEKKAQLRRARVVRNRVERGESFDKIYGS